ncbi:keratin, type II cytoskeletal 1 isoform X2 [Harpegnathos saltator]|uniref:keratin, type II cytoskeletal 1 isoform X2 n=1 Tax=Harpegnathos saltator TaxID=610380 RepID=UPI000DBEDC23|nr:keratin, type II cytoskeletal 1 isoform X2 [Harpegnathos saltator]
MQYILAIPNTMAVRAFNLVFLFSFVTALLGLPTVIPDENHTLPTDLQPPPIEKEHHTTVFVLNLYAVKNSSSNKPEEMFQNEIIEAVPDILEPLAIVLLVVENDEEEKEHLLVDLDDFAGQLQGEGYKVDKVNHNGKTKMLKLKLSKEEAQNMVEAASKPHDDMKPREKRTICLKCGGGGGGGGYRGGYDMGGYCRTCGGGYPSGGGGNYPPSGGGGYGLQIPIVIVPIGTGHGHGHRRGHGGGGGGYPSGGGGYPSGGGGYPGGGCNSCGGGGGGYGGGGGGSYSQSSAQASAQSSSSGWGGK